MCNPLMLPKDSPLHNVIKGRNANADKKVNAHNCLEVGRATMSDLSPACIRASMSYSRKQNKTSPS